MRDRENPKWSISGIFVEGLFGELDHEFQMDQPSGITILIGPNGVGKTKVLGLIEALLNLQVSKLLTEPYCRIEVRFRSGEVLECRRFAEHGSSEASAKISLHTKLSNHWWLFSTTDLNQFEDWAEDRALLRRKRLAGSKYWLTGARFLNTDQLLNEAIIHGEIEGQPFDAGEDAQSIKKFLGSENALMIAANRIDNLIHPAESIGRYSLLEPVESTKIADYIQGEFETARREYLRVSQELDSTFPSRLLDETGETVREKTFESEEEFRAVYGFLSESFREITANVGIGGLEMAPLPTRSLEPWEIRALTLHVWDGLAKIGALRSLSTRIEVFENLVNSKLVRSNITVKPTGLVLEFNDGRSESPGSSNLSSGERHQIQMAFDLVFKGKTKSLILIDEPEISLHVNWQNEILREFSELREVNQSQYLVATHSPEIIGGAWDSVRPLTFLNEGRG